MNDLLVGRLLEAWTEQEVLPQPTPNYSETVAPARPREVPIVSLREAMTFVNDDVDAFAEKHAPTK